jgi:tight adherence protein B
MRRRLEQAGFPKAAPRTFWMICGIVALVAAGVAILTHQSPLVIALAVFVMGLGLPRWVLGFLTNRRKKKFTEHFAPAIDVIVRSVRSGLPTNEALRIVARESPDPVGTEFHNLVESLKVGVTLDQAMKRMMESMPTPEVGFFAIVMTIQSKSGGNLSEALSNLAFVLRDRKRLQGKIKAMSSEAKASAMIIGSLPPGVMGIVYLTTPDYIAKLFTEKAGNLMLAGCVIWMSIGITVMRKMINFKH